ncbi:MAG: succinate dehydrogenase cytochrome b subunit [Chloroherpetonaceae bacterium]|nr:succinate dehydrogenase cytochrome b subunit [Chloroherpetonaceae bacterium]
MIQLTLLRKLVMALTGLFLCVFLVIHLLGNLQLFLPKEHAQEQFNAYSQLLSGNPLIKVVSIVLYLSILAHAIYAVVITIYNRKSGGNYTHDSRSKVSPWYSRSMGVLGTVLFVFIVVHFQNFWYYYKFTAMPLDAWGRKDLYSAVVNLFANGWYVVLYVVSMIAMGYHLLHGVYSAVRTLGLYHPKYVNAVKFAGVAYTVIIAGGFTIIPIYVFFVQHQEKVLSFLQVK